ncbi:MAG: DNA topoisomerase 4 subunit A [Clostridiales bacterium]|nr:DNA topoisomerase 4 subunit A [Clostridiales bacterium]
MARKKIVEELPVEEKIISRPLSKAIPDFMMPYAEYIILERALPRVEDGLKPVQRRILYTMNELNMKPDGPYKKSARVVGDCLGKYHPHGDTSIYDAMVKMAQEFNMRNTLVNGHGNFGSIDGDGAAAMRYTEVKLEVLACELLRDLDKDTVKWVKNFDDSLMEPDLLPGRFPNLLVNGSMGIAIGLATNIPAHNLSEVIDGVVAFIDNPKIKLPDLLKIIKGPDFPTGGFIIPGDTFESIYETGKGKFFIRARAEIENAGNGKQAIVITEIPYGVNKARLQQRIMELRDDAVEAAKKNSAKADITLSGIQEIVDESDRNGIRVVIRLKKGEDAFKVLDYLYKKTDMQVSFGVNMVAIADGRPQQLGLTEYLNYYVKHQQNVILKRSQFDLNNAKKREHILDGYVIILPDIDTVVQLIKTSSSRSEAKDKLRAHFGLTEKQADAILDLKLVNITRMEVTKIEKELRELKQLIAELEKIVSSKTEQLKVVKKELLEIRQKYPCKRLSIIVNNEEDIAHKPYEINTDEGKRGYVSVDANGLVKFLSPRQYSIADRSEPTVVNETSKVMQFVDKNEQIILFGSLGNCYRLNVNDMRESGWKDKGETLTEIYADAPKDEKVVSAIKLTENNADKQVFIVTKNGMVKRSDLSEYIVNKDSYLGMVLKEGDEVVVAEIADGNSNLVFVSSDGLSLNTPVEEYPVQGRKAGGVIGMSLNDGASVAWAGQIEREDDEIIGELLLVSNGYAKRVVASYVEPSKRARKGVKVIDLTDKRLVFAGAVKEECKIALINKQGVVFTVDSEDVLIDRNRAGKGKPLVVSADCYYGVKQIAECEVNAE